MTPIDCCFSFIMNNHIATNYFINFNSNGYRQIIAVCDSCLNYLNHIVFKNKQRVSEKQYIKLIALE